MRHALLICACGAGLATLVGCPGTATPPHDVAPVVSATPVSVDSAPSPLAAPTPQAETPVSFDPQTLADPAPRPTPAAPAAVLGASATDLARWVRAEDATPEVRYAALRQLETQDPEGALELATTLVHDPTGIVRTNAIALLARSDDPRAQATLVELGPRERRLAARLASRAPRERTH